MISTFIKTSFVSALILLLFSAGACSSLQRSTTSSAAQHPADWCATEYPVIFIHGLALKDELHLASYWGDIPEQLHLLGCSTYFGGQDAYNSHKTNAELIAARIELILQDNKTDKVNIIAHSKGGIEARYLISILGYHNRVASLTTICTPHQGSSIADLIYSEMETNKPVKEVLVNAASLQAISIGDRNADPYSAGKQLTTSYMKEFNKTVLDIKSVYYQSYAAKMRKTYPDSILKEIGKVLYEYEGDNDGLVSVNSAKWGNYMGIIMEDEINGLSHADVIDLFPRNPCEREKICDFYIQLVHDLKLRGF